MLIVNNKWFYLAVPSQSGPADGSEDISAEVPSAVTVEVDEVHPLPDVSKPGFLEVKSHNSI